MHSPEIIECVMRIHLRLLFRFESNDRRTDVIFGFGEGDVIRDSGTTLRIGDGREGISSDETDARILSSEMYTDD